MARTEFVCLHCGECCTDPLVQINLSFGDILRLGEPVERLFSEGTIDFLPFFDPEELRYDIELGLTKPCSFWKHDLCSIYRKRPLNCRMFPYYLISAFPANELKQIFGKEFKCVHELNLNESVRKRYAKYSRSLGKFVMAEAKISDQLLGELKKRFNFFPNGLEAGMPKSKQDERLRLQTANKLVADLKTKALVKAAISLIRSSRPLVSIAELERLEKIIKFKSIAQK